MQVAGLVWCAFREGQECRMGKSAGEGAGRGRIGRGLRDGSDHTYRVKVGHSSCRLVVCSMFLARTSR
jgi:hypothetical protein